jgi:undecaprenyl-diphosphatase
MLLVFYFGSWAFIAIAGEVKEGDTKAFDMWALKSLRKADDPAEPIGPPWMAEVGRDLTALGGVAVLILFTLIVAGDLWLDGKHRAMWFLLLAIGGGLLVSQALKSFFDRPRPDLVPHLTEVYTASFPSGHAMLSAVVYLTLGAMLVPLVSRRLKLYVLSVALLLTFLVGVSRVYMGVHYPTDVLAGWAAGLVWATLSQLVLRRLQRRGEAESG